MSSTQSDISEFIPLPLDELFWWWTDDAQTIPCFLGEVGDIMKHIEAHGFQIYYLIATVPFKYQDGNITKISKRNAVLKVASTLVGKTIVETNDLELDEVEPAAWFALPKIPLELVSKMDTFFRSVDEMHGTESIVLLTYDTNKTDSSGWGVLVPDQTNTTVDCDYEPASVAGEKPDHVMIVGSAHSHPGMSAYASGTDHKDQAHFDGIHITFGWMKSKNDGATEYHIELQMQGNEYIFTPAQIFAKMPDAPLDDELQDWVSKVKKKTYSAGTTGGSGYTGASQYSGQHGSFQGGWSGNKAKFPNDAPSPNSTILVGVLNDANEKRCPFCETLLISADIEKRRCLACRQYIALPGENLEDMAQIRSDNKYYSSEIDPTTNPAKSIVLWIRNGAHNEYYTVYTPDKVTVGELGK